MLHTTAFPGRCIRVHGLNYLYFGGTDYLGLSNHPEYLKLLFKNLKKWGANFGSSRAANVRLSVFDEAEAAFADWLGCEATLTVSSGTLAAQLALESYGEKTRFYHLSDTHPAAVHPESLLWNGKVFASGNAVISADTFPSLAVQPLVLDNIIADFGSDVSLLADDSHGLGISGIDGQGQWPSLKNLPVKEVLLVSSLAKALCMPGGLIAGSRKRIEKIKSHTGFITASGMPPAYLQTFMEASALYKTQYEKLQNNLRDFSSFMQNHFFDFQFSPDYPVVYSNHKHLAAFLEENHILITNFDYPQSGNTLNRIVLSAHHRRPDLQALAAALKKFVNT